MVMKINEKEKKTKKKKKDATTSMKIDKKKVADTIFEYKKNDWREIKPGSTYNQEYLRRRKLGIPVRTA
tara:strand:- start:36 stop:242 length:207 start_codon:yes stop_codon:yes gene_type:complete